MWSGKWSPCSLLWCCYPADGTRIQQFSNLCCVWLSGWIMWTHLDVLVDAFERILQTWSALIRSHRMPQSKLVVVVVMTSLPKTVEVRIMQLPPQSSRMILVFSQLTLTQNYKGNIGSRGTEWERSRKNMQFSEFCATSHFRRMPFGMQGAKAVARLL